MQGLCISYGCMSEYKDTYKVCTTSNHKPRQTKAADLDSFEVPKANPFHAPDITWSFLSRMWSPDSNLLCGVSLERPLPWTGSSVDFLLAYATSKDAFLHSDNCILYVCFHLHDRHNWSWLEYNYSLYPTHTHTHTLACFGEHKRVWSKSEQPECR